MAAGVAAVAVIAVAVTFWNGADEQPIGTVARGPVAPRRWWRRAPRLAPADPSFGLRRRRGRGHAGRAAPAAAVVALPAPHDFQRRRRLVGLLAASARRGIVADLLSPAEGADKALELAALDVPLLGAERPIEMNAVDAGERQ